MTRMLIDAEEYLPDIHNDSSKSYFAEAVACFNAGAYRASVVMMACAVFEDLRLKVKAYGPYDGTADELSGVLEKAYQEQKSYEAESFRMLRHSGMLEPTDKNYLLSLITARNNAAHASGVAITESEAYRFVEEGARRIVAVRLMWDEQGVAELIRRMARTDLFPPTAFEHFNEITQAELASLHPRVHGLLIDTIADQLGSAGPIFQRNTTRLFTCLAARQDGAIRHALFEKLIATRTLDPSNVWLFEMLAADPRILKGKARNIHAVDAGLAAICANIDTEDDNQIAALETVFLGLLADGSSGTLSSDLAALTRAIGSKLWLRPTFVSGLEHGGPVRDILVDGLVVRTLDPDMAEGWLAAVVRTWEEDDERFFAAAISEETALSLLRNLANGASAGKPVCARVLNSGCQMLPSLRRRAIGCIEAEPDVAWRILEDDEDGGISPKEFLERYLSVDRWIREEEGGEEDAGRSPRSFAGRTVTAAGARARRFGR
ncbi:hypothetical protein ABIE78_001594 [Sinorhizobium fredii]|uniref:Uncharacterized protein n=1 Tax=Sinorhizobium fredii (strain USDA 257) TaxID=1185652 RepID=I3X9G9_SINF2|nr:hypothetical protein [Sinorhizobium fredii]AFL52525.1 hypothetical protein USDA257_c39810 [Sinorhizobium fredii USDA 257]